MHRLGFLICFLQLHNLVSTDVEIGANTTVTEVIEKYGYPVETHHVVTEDGYILALFRIPYSAKSPAAPNKPVAFLHHGLSVTSRIWVLLGSEKGLGFVLADEGYDVWLGNYRGTLYSRNHTKFSDKSKQFWNFSIDEFCIYDTPAMVDYVINKTGVEKHYHVGISLGATVLLGFLSAKPEYNKNVRIMVCQGPTVFFKGSSNSALSPSVELLIDLMERLGINEFIPDRRINNLLAKYICPNNLTSFICTNMLFFFTGYDPQQLNRSLVPIIISHVASGLSLKTGRHFFQLYKSGKFQMYDYGKLNMRKYGQPNPPEYNLRAITAPVSIMYAKRDPYYNETDITHICRAVSNCVELYRVPKETFTHFGFVFATDVKTLVNDVLLEQIKRY